MAFGGSDCGTLAVLCADDSSTVVLFDWQSGTEMFRFASCSGQSRCLLFEPGTPERRSLRLWTCSNVGLMEHVLTAGEARTVVHGFAGRAMSLDCTSACFATGGYSGVRSVVVGTAGGELIRLSEGNAEDVVRAHEQAVVDVCGGPGGRLCSTSADGSVKLWSGSMETLYSLSLPLQLQGAKHFPLRCTWDDKSAALFVSTTRGGVLHIVPGEEDTAQHVLTVRGVGTSGTGAVAWHPRLSVVAVGGLDGTLGIWETSPLGCLKELLLNCAVGACAFSSDGEQLAVGLGSALVRQGQRLAGTLQVFSRGGWVKVHEGRDAHAAVTAMAFAPSSAMLAMGCVDGRVYVYNAREEYTLQAMLGTHKAAVTSVDFSVDSQFLQVRPPCVRSLRATVHGVTPPHWSQTSSEGDILSHAMAHSCEAVTNPATIRDVEWHTWTSRVGWPVQGLGKASRANDNASFVVRGGGDLLCTAANDGSIHLLRFPTLDGDACWVRSPGFAPGSAAAAFSPDGTRVAVAGGPVPSVCILRVQRFHEAIAEHAAGAGTLAVRAQRPDQLIGKVLKRISLAGRPAAPLRVPVPGLQPWLSAVVPPTSLPPVDCTPPACAWPLVALIGLPHEATSNALQVSMTGTLWTACGGTLTASEQWTGRRQYVQAPNAALLQSMSADSHGRVLAAGTLGVRGQVLLLDGGACAMLNCIPALPASQGVSLVSMSPSGKRLMCAHAGAHATLAMYGTARGDWTDAQQWGMQASGAEAPLCLVATDQDECVAVSASRSGILCWTWAAGQLQSCPVATDVLPERDRAQALRACVHDGAVVLGTTSGHLYVLSPNGRTVAAVAQAHDCAVYAMAAWGRAFPGLLATADKRGNVKVWGRVDTAPLCVVSLAASLPAQVDATVTGLAWRPEGDAVVALCRGGSLVSMTLAKRVSLLQAAPAVGRLWGVAAHPAEPAVVGSVGEEGLVAIWDVQRGVLLRGTRLGMCLRAVAWSPDGRALAVGVGGETSYGREPNAGLIVVLDAASLEVRCRISEAADTVNALRFSPDGLLLAAACEDGAVYLFSAGRDYRLVGRSVAHGAGVQHVDFSVDGAYLQSACCSFDLAFHTADAHRMPTPSRLRDVVWHTQSCPFGWAVQGVWRSLPEGATSVLAVARSRSGRWLAVALGTQGLALFRYPCPAPAPHVLLPGTQGRQFVGLEFTADDKYLVGASVEDRAVMAWKVLQR